MAAIPPPWFGSHHLGDVAVYHKYTRILNYRVVRHKLLAMVLSIMFYLCHASGWIQRGRIEMKRLLHSLSPTLSSMVRLMQAAGDFIRPLSSPPSARKTNPPSEDDSIFVEDMFNMGDF
jgi:hypothetical protein